MELKNNTIRQLKEIKVLFDEIETKFNKIDNIDQEIINDFHNENHSLNHFVRWGADNTEEILKEYGNSLNTPSYSVEIKYLELNFSLYINNIKIYSDIFQEEKIKYKLIEREELINDLIGWISEGNNQKDLMINDLKYLMSLKDEFIFSSILTNEYIAKSDSEKEFNDICKEILLLNDEIENKDNKRMSD